MGFEATHLSESRVSVSSRASWASLRMLGICIRLASPDTAPQYQSSLHCWTSQGWSPTFFAEAMAYPEDPNSYTDNLSPDSLARPSNLAYLGTSSPCTVLPPLIVYRLIILRILESLPPYPPLIIIGIHYILKALAIYQYQFHLPYLVFIKDNCDCFLALLIHPTLGKRRPPPCGWRRSCSSLNNLKLLQSVWTKESGGRKFTICQSPGHLAC
jgi:hypothetical protein